MGMPTPCAPRGHAKQRLCPKATITLVQSTGQGAGTACLEAGGRGLDHRHELRAERAFEAVVA
jgi:hypothetical protein